MRYRRVKPKSAHAILHVYNIKRRYHTDYIMPSLLHEFCYQ